MSFVSIEKLTNGENFISVSYKNVEVHIVNLPSYNFYFLNFITLGVYNFQDCYAHGKGVLRLYFLYSKKISTSEFPRIFM